MYTGTPALGLHKHQSKRPLVSTYVRPYLRRQNGATTRGVLQQVSRLPRRRRPAADGSPAGCVCSGEQGRRLPLPAGSGWRMLLPT